MSFKPIILCGGSGTRLWPASRKHLPKQFLPLFEDKTLLDLTIERIKFFKNIKKPILISSKNHGFHVSNALDKNNLKASIILEPIGKNTTAAIYLAAKSSAKNDILLIMSSDALITDNQYFSNKIDLVYKNFDNKNWVIFGIQPTYPAEQFGYINVKLEKNQINEIFNKVENFVEKPSKQNAESMIEKKSFFWNAGIFMGNASMIIDSIKLHAPEIAEACDNACKTSNHNQLNDEIHFNYEVFNQIPSQSIDYSVMEKADNVILSPLECEWDDVGSWDALSRISKAKNIQKNIFQISTKNTFIKNDKRVIATIGVEDLIIIDSDNATLVAKKGHSEKVKDIVEELKAKKIIEADEHSFEIRPWGKFTIILNTGECKVKKIEVSPNKRLSLQYHNHRSEHWLVIKGQANVYLDGIIKVLTPGNSIDIPKLSHHYIENKENDPLVIIETQLGTYFGEDDIVRLDDPYNRK
jgi:mannose-1-phosphate guanylyltransferase/mannose-6-phosphate isomerase